MMGYHGDRRERAAGINGNSGRAVNAGQNQADFETAPQIDDILTSAAGKTKPTLRIVHQMARSGGTIISRCLGCMRDVVLLSEIHPLGLNRYNPLDQAHNWFRLLTASDIRRLQERKQVPFEEAMELIYDRCSAMGKTLMIRDWNHLDFTGIPFLKEPAYRLLTAEALSSRFSIQAVATVRHPIDQWLSLRTLDIFQGKIDLDRFLVGYHKYAEFCQKIGFVRYEDFTKAPEKHMERICYQLSVSYDPAFIDKWRKYTTITGDNQSERGYKEIIKPVPRRHMETGLADQFEENPDYRRIIEIFGYSHPG